MSRGSFDWSYTNNPDVKKPIEAIWQDIDQYTAEFFADEPQYREVVDFFGVIPPVLYEGQFVKGIMFTQGADLIGEFCPRIKEFFHVINGSYFASYAKSPHADGIFSNFHYPEREAWFKVHFPELSEKPLIPCEEADFSSDNLFMPDNRVPKDIDILCVSTMQEWKNIPMIAGALKIYRKKHPEKPVRLTWVVGKKFTLNYTELVPRELAVIKQIEQILGHTQDYIDFLPFVNNHELPQVYSRAKCFVLASLIEGRNRATREALSCGTPVVTFKHINQYIRKDEGFVPPNCGNIAEEFSEESLADALYETVEHYQDFNVRSEFLRQGGGRINFLNRCIDAFPYYKEKLPGYQAGNHQNNLWLDLAIQHNYGISLHDYLYHRNMEFTRLKGLEGMTKAVILSETKLSGKPLSDAQLTKFPSH